MIEKNTVEVVFDSLKNVIFEIEKKMFDESHISCLICFFGILLFTRPCITLNSYHDNVIGTW